jgi:plasmid stabilization system protein ParE
MKYTVLWKPAAEQELARIWSQASNRAAVTAAAAEIDRLLVSDPTQQGESRSGAMRVLFVEPVGIFFHVAGLDRIASVLRVWTVT